MSEATASGSADASMPDDDESAGLAGERTDLAWSRSGLAVITGIAALVKRLIDLDHSPIASVAVALLMVAGGGAWLLALAHARHMARSTADGRLVPDANVLRVVAMGTAAFGVASALIALTPLP